MEAWPVKAAHVPVGLPPLRAWRWCVLRTLRDGRLAQRRGRPLSRPNLERLFCRRWSRVVHSSGKSAGWQRMVDKGRKVIRKSFAQPSTFT